MPKNQRNAIVISGKHSSHPTRASINFGNRYKLNGYIDNTGKTIIICGNIILLQCHKIYDRLNLGVEMKFSGLEAHTYTIEYNMKKRKIVFPALSVI